MREREGEGRERHKDTEGEREGRETERHRG